MTALHCRFARPCALATLAAAAAVGSLAPTLAAAEEPPVNAAGVEPVRVRAVARFGFDASEVRVVDRQRLLADVAQMKDVSWQRVEAVGHADAKGSDAYNDKLATRRAEAVKQYLVSQGIEPALVQTASRGSADPVADNATADGRARNRRTEVEFVGVRVSAPAAATTTK